MDNQEEATREREIWAMSELQDWDEYLINKIKNQAKDRQEFRKTPKRRRGT